MTPFEPYPEVNPGWVNDTTSTPLPIVEATAGTELQSTHTQSIEVEAPVVQEMPVAEDELLLLKRLGHSYQLLASSIVKAKQAQQELRGKLNFYKAAIDQRQHELQQVLAQLAEHQTNPQAIPANEAEIAEEFAQLQALLKGSHHESLLNKLNQMQVAVEQDRQHLPELLKTMRAELDLVILQALRLTALENLNEAYKKYRQFQEYNSRAEQEFQSLVRAFNQS